MRSVEGEDTDRVPCIMQHDGTRESGGGDGAAFE